MSVIDLRKLRLFVTLALALLLLGGAPALAQISFTDLFSGLAGGAAGGEGVESASGPDINGVFAGQVPGIIPLNIEIDISEEGGEVHGGVVLLTGQIPAGEFDMSGSYDRRARKVRLTVELDPAIDLLGEVSPDGKRIEFDIGIEVFRGLEGGRIEGLFFGPLGSFDVPLLGDVEIALGLELFEEEPGMLMGNFDTRVGGEFFGFGDISGSIESQNDNGDRMLNLEFRFEDGDVAAVEAVVPFDLSFLAIPEFELRLKRGSFFDGNLAEIGDGAVVIFNESTDDRAVIAVNRNTRCNIFEIADEGFPEPIFERGRGCLTALKVGALTFVSAVERDGDLPPLALEIEQKPVVDGPPRPPNFDGPDNGFMPEEPFFSGPDESNNDDGRDFGPERFDDDEFKDGFDDDFKNDEKPPEPV